MITINRIKQLTWALVLPLSLAGCGGLLNDTQPSSDEDNIRITRFEQKSDCGNQSSYTLHGKTYKVLESEKGYKKNGIASWYGAEYQGSETASCETFDMYALTAAHRTLPLPSYVKVTNQKNGKSVIVRVNDRGPFDSENEIELSFAAANAIGMVKSKTAPVTIAAITPDQLKGTANLPASTSKHSSTRDSKDKSMISYAKAPGIQSKNIYYIVAGTFISKGEALDRFVRITAIGISKAEMATAYGKDREVFMVRIGPLHNQDQIDNIKDRLSGDGLSNFKVVKETLK